MNEAAAWALSASAAASSNDGVKQNEIAEELGIDKSNVSRHIKRARETGLLDREHQQ